MLWFSWAKSLFSQLFPSPVIIFVISQCLFKLWENSIPSLGIDKYYFVSNSEPMIKVLPFSKEEHVLRVLDKELRFPCFIFFFVKPWVVYLVNMDMHMILLKNRDFSFSFNKKNTLGYTEKVLYNNGKNRYLVKLGYPLNSKLLSAKNIYRLGYCVSWDA